MARSELSWIKVVVFACVFAFLYAAMYFAFANIFYYVYNGQSMFKQIHYFEWVEYLEGAGAMLVGVFLVELVRNIIRKKRSATQ